MNFSKYLALLKFFALQTPATALALLKKLDIKHWGFIRDGVETSGYRWKFKVQESFKEKMLVAEGTRGNESYVVMTRFKNDGTDRLIINGVDMQGVELDFDVMGWTDTIVQVEARYNFPDDEPGRDKHEDAFFNQL